MDCAFNKRLINERLDGTISSLDDRVLETHLAGCASCRREWAMLVAVDLVLAGEPLSQAPAGFELSVVGEITSRVEARRRIESIVIPSACGAAAIAVGYGVHRLVNWQAVSTTVRGIGEAANGAVTPLVEPSVGTSGFLATLLQNPAAQGAMMALAVAATIFLGISAIRVARQFTLEYH